MDPCLLCDPNSEPRGSGAAPICPSHHQQARAAFERAEPLLRAHLEQAHGAELDGWVQHGVVPGLTWQLLMREPAPAPAPGATWRPGRLLEFRQDPDGVVRLLRELLLSAVQQERRGQETAVMLRMGTP